MQRRQGGKRRKPNCMNAESVRHPPICLSEVADQTRLLLMKFLVSFVVNSFSSVSPFFFSMATAAAATFLVTSLIRMNRSLFQNAGSTITHYNE